MKYLLTQWETEEENRRFLIKLSNHCPEEVMLENEQKVKFFLARLLALLVGWPRFRIVIDLASLTVGLAIGKVESTGRKIAVGFSGWSL